MLTLCLLMLCPLVTEASVWSATDLQSHNDFVSQLNAQNSPIISLPSDGLITSEFLDSTDVFFDSFVKGKRTDEGRDALRDWVKYRGGIFIAACYNPLGKECMETIEVFGFDIYAEYTRNLRPNVVLECSGKHSLVKGVSEVNDWFPVGLEYWYKPNIPTILCTDGGLDVMEIVRFGEGYVIVSGRILYEDGYIDRYDNRKFVENLISWTECVSNCNDGDLCTIDSCDANMECVHSEINCDGLCDSRSGCIGETAREFACSWWGELKTNGIFRWFDYLPSLLLASDATFLPPVESDLSFEILNSIDVFFAQNPTTNLTTDEQNLLYKWVQEKGGLLVIANPKEKILQNYLEPFGLQIGASEYVRECYGGHQLVEGIAQIASRRALSIQFDPDSTAYNATVLCTNGRDDALPMLTVFEYGRGYILPMFEGQMNRAFTKNLVIWTESLFSKTASISQTVAPVRTPSVVNPTNSTSSPTGAPADVPGAKWQLERSSVYSANSPMEGAYYDQFRLTLVASNTSIDTDSHTWPSDHNDVYFAVDPKDPIVPEANFGFGFLYGHRHYRKWVELGGVLLVDCSVKYFCEAYVELFGLNVMYYKTPADTGTCSGSHPLVRGVDGVYGNTYRIVGNSDSVELCSSESGDLTHSVTKFGDGYVVTLGNPLLKNVYKSDNLRFLNNLISWADCVAECDDGDDCTTDSCDTEHGCIHTHIDCQGYCDRRFGCFEPSGRGLVWGNKIGSGSFSSGRSLHNDSAFEEFQNLLEASKAKITFPEFNSVTKTYLDSIDVFFHYFASLERSELQTLQSWVQYDSGIVIIDQNQINDRSDNLLRTFGLSSDSIFSNANSICSGDEQILSGVEYVYPDALINIGSNVKVFSCECDQGATVALIKYGNGYVFTGSGIFDDLFDFISASDNRKLVQNLILWTETVKIETSKPSLPPTPTDKSPPESSSKSTPARVIVFGFVFVAVFAVCGSYFKLSNRSRKNDKQIEQSLTKTKVEDASLEALQEEPLANVVG